MVVNTHLQFSLQHQFFDALLDKISELISAKTLLSSHKFEQLLVKHQGLTSSPVVYFGAAIYKAVGDRNEQSEAVFVSAGQEIKFASLDEITSWLEKNGLTASFIQLEAQQSIVPSFHKQDCTLVTAALLQQWFNFGPFGFHVEWLKEMPNYNANYITRALLYIDKSLSTNEWLLGYGVNSKSMPEGDSEPSISSLVNKLDICRPICILDAETPFAYINDIAAELVFESLTNGKRKVFKNKQAFKQLLAKQGGLYDDQLLWLIDVLPETQLQQYAYRICKTVDDILLKCGELGITRLLVNDNHPFSQDIISYYQALELSIILERQKFDLESNRFSIKCETRYPIEPLSPFRSLVTGTNIEMLNEKHHLAEGDVNNTTAFQGNHTPTYYMLLSHDPIRASEETILQCKVLNIIG